MSNKNKESSQKSKTKNFGVFFANRKLVNSVTAVGFAVAGIYHISLWHSDSTSFLNLALGSGFLSITVIYTYLVYSEIKNKKPVD